MSNSYEARLAAIESALAEMLKHLDRRELLGTREIARIEGILRTPK